MLARTSDLIKRSSAINRLYRFSLAISKTEAFNLLLFIFTILSRVKMLAEIFPA